MNRIIVLNVDSYHLLGYQGFLSCILPIPTWQRKRIHFFRFEHKDSNNMRTVSRLVSRWLIFECGPLFFFLFSPKSVTHFISVEKHEWHGSLLMFTIILVTIIFFCFLSSNSSSKVARKYPIVVKKSCYNSVVENSFYLDAQFLVIFKRVSTGNSQYFFIWSSWKKTAFHFLSSIATTTYNAKLIETQRKEWKLWKSKDLLLLLLSTLYNGIYPRLDCRLLSHSFFMFSVKTRVYVS